MGEDRDRWTDKRSANEFNSLAGLEERHTINHLCVVYIHLSSYNSLVQILSRRLQRWQEHPFMRYCRQSKLESRRCVIMVSAILLVSHAGTDIVKGIDCMSDWLPVNSRSIRSILLKMARERRNSVYRP